MFEVTDGDDLHEIFSSLIGVIDSMVENSPDEDQKNKLNTLKVCVESLRDRCFPPPPPFYPQPGTVFAEEGSCTPYVTCEKDSMFKNSEGGVSYDDRVHGICEYPDWVKQVREEKLQLVWCPKFGRVASNGEWLAAWGLV